MLSPSPVSLVYGLLGVILPVVAQYNLVKEYAGNGFLDDWTFYGGIDNLTWGNATRVSSPWTGKKASTDYASRSFVDATTAATKKLAYVDAATNHTILRVDNTTKVPPGTPRNSIRINSNDLYGVGSLWVADFLHVPFGVRYAVDECRKTARADVLFSALFGALSGRRLRPQS